jgi:hypothetical protein
LGRPDDERIAGLGGELFWWDGSHADYCR